MVVHGLIILYPEFSQLLVFGVFHSLIVTMSLHHIHLCLPAGVHAGDARWLVQCSQQHHLCVQLCDQPLHLQWLEQLTYQPTPHIRQTVSQGGPPTLTDQGTLPTWGS